MLLSANPPLTDLTIQIRGYPPYDLARGIANKPGLRRNMAWFLIPGNLARRIALTISLGGSRKTSHNFIPQV